MNNSKVWFFPNLVKTRNVAMGESAVRRVYDEDGDPLFDLPAILGPSETQMVLRVINNAYDKGYRAGGEQRAKDFRDVLGIKSNDPA
jgi:hypothetical protein